jgi:hypothetical protein
MEFKKIQIILAIFLLFIAGCAQGGINPELLVKTNTQVNTFLEEYPNADLNLLYYSQNASVELSEEYLNTCGRELTPKAMYRFSLTDEPSGLNILGYLDVDNQVVDCVKRESQNVQTIDESIGTKVNGSNDENSKTETKIKVEGVELSETSNNLIHEIETYLNSYNQEVSFQLEVKQKNEKFEVDSEVEGLINTDLDEMWSSLLDSINSDLESLDINSKIEIKIELESKFHGEENKNRSYETETKIESEGFDLSEENLNQVTKIEEVLETLNSEVGLSYEIKFKEDKFEDEVEVKGELSLVISNLWDELITSIRTNVESLDSPEEIKVKIEIERKSHGSDDDLEEELEESEKHEKEDRKDAMEDVQDSLEDARGEIDDLKEDIEDNLEDGLDVTSLEGLLIEAESLLLEAQIEYDLGNYEVSHNLAEEAKYLVKDYEKEDKDDDKEDDDKEDDDKEDDDKDDDEKEDEDEDDMK